MLLKQRMMSFRARFANVTHKMENLLGIFYHSDGRADVTFLLVQQAQLICGEWHQVVVMLDILFTAKKKEELNLLK